MNFFSALSPRSILVLMHCMVIVIGTLFAGVGVKILDGVVQDGGRLGGIEFLAYYGFTLFAVPLLWLACTEICERNPWFGRFYSWLMVIGWVLIPVLILVFLAYGRPHGIM